jgi:tRNA(Ser,Leu) C12 N-acetylase TAN1
MWEIRRRKDQEFQREEMNWVLGASVRGEGVWNTEMGNPEGND